MNAKPVKNQQKPIAPSSVRSEYLLAGTELVPFLCRYCKVSVRTLTVPPAEVVRTLLLQLPFGRCNFLLLVNHYAPFHLALRFDEFSFDICQALRLSLLFYHFFDVRFFLLTLLVVILFLV